MRRHLPGLAARRQLRYDSRAPWSCSLRLHYCHALLDDIPGFPSSTGGFGLTPEQQACLVDRIRQGDAAAEDELVRHFQRPVLALVVARTRDREACRDLTQEALLATLVAIRQGRIRDAAKLAAFVSGTARNIVFRFFRSKRIVLLPLEGAPEAAVLPDEDLDSAERTGIVSEALERLEEGERVVLELTWLDGLTPRQIARRLGLSSDVVRTRKSRALRKVVEYVRTRREVAPRSALRGHAHGL